LSSDDLLSEKWRAKAKLARMRGDAQHGTG
jgi:hypothetical protein